MEQRRRDGDPPFEEESQQYPHGDPRRGDPPIDDLPHDRDPAPAPEALGDEVPRPDAAEQAVPWGAGSPDGDAALDDDEVPRADAVEQSRPWDRR